MTKTDLGNTFDISVTKIPKDEVKDSIDEYNDQIQKIIDEICQNEPKTSEVEKNEKQEPNWEIRLTDIRDEDIEITRRDGQPIQMNWRDIFTKNQRAICELTGLRIHLCTWSDETRKDCSNIHDFLIKPGTWDGPNQISDQTAKDILKEMQRLQELHSAEELLDWKPLKIRIKNLTKDKVHLIGFKKLGYLEESYQKYQPGTFYWFLWQAACQLDFDVDICQYECYPDQLFEPIYKPRPFDVVFTQSRPFLEYFEEAEKNVMEVVNADAMEDDDIDFSEDCEDSALSPWHGQLKIMDDQLGREFIVNTIKQLPKFGYNYTLTRIASDGYFILSYYANSEFQDLMDIYESLVHEKAKELRARKDIYGKEDWQKENQIGCDSNED